MSKFVSHGTNLIVAGKTVNGREYGGTYYPAGQKPGGNPYPARWTGNFFVNSRNRDAEAMVIKVTAWNSKSAKEGKGRADLFARNLSRGKCMHLDLEPQVHEQKRYAQDGNGGSRLVVDGQGNPIMDKVTTYRVLDFEFGNDSANQTAKEMMAFDATNPQMDVFNRRPLNYNGAMAENDPRYAQHAGDVELWKTVQNIRKSAVYVPGNSEYGYAHVAPASWNNGAGANAYAAGNLQGAIAAGTAIPDPNVNGITLDALRQKGWTDAQIKADLNFRVLLPADAPPPPINIPDAPATEAITPEVTEEELPDGTKIAESDLPF